jgi:hypothetical protein
VRGYGSIITLVIISQCLCLVGGHVVSIIADLEDQSLRYSFVVRSVACYIPVVEHGVPHGTSLPPVVSRGRLFEEPRNVILSSLISCVVAHQIECDGGCGALYGSWNNVR